MTKYNKLSEGEVELKSAAERENIRLIIDSSLRDDFSVYVDSLENAVYEAILSN